jgi:hypothetical protein
MRSLLAGCCLFTIAASCWIATMAVVLHRDGYGTQVGLALFLALESTLTLRVLSQVLRALRARLVVAAGAVAIAGVGIRAIDLTLTRLHFEGYAVVIGAALVLQGFLTLWSLYGKRVAFSSRTAPIW